MRSELSYWLRSSGLQIVTIVSVSLLLLRMFDTGARVIERRMRTRSGDDIASRTRGAEIQAVRYALSITTGTVSVLLILSRFSIPLGSLIPVATVAGTGLGFGAQRVVGDFLAGFFLVSERQFGVGDMIKVSAVGSDEGVVGVVEEVTLRVTRIRRLNGDIVIFPNSALQQVSNMSRDWARVLVEVPVPSHLDVDVVAANVDRVSREMYEDPDWRPKILEVPVVSGVERLLESGGQLSLRVIGRTLPGEQWSVERELRHRIAREGSDLTVVHTTSLTVDDVMGSEEPEPVDPDASVDDADSDEEDPSEASGGDAGPDGDDSGTTAGDDGDGGNGS